MHEPGFSSNGNCFPSAGEARVAAVAPTHRIDALPVYADFLIPYVTPQRPDGTYLFGGRDPDKLEHCVSRRLCQLCGGALMSPMVSLLHRAEVRLQRNGLIHARTNEPAFHPHCAIYAIPTCPVLARRLIEEVPSAEPSEQSLVHGAADEHATLTAVAHLWLEVWIDRYEVIPPSPGDRAAALLTGIARRARPLTKNPHLNIQLAMNTSATSTEAHHDAP